MTSPITVEPYETVEFPDSDTDSWQVVNPCDSDNDDVITTESDVVSSSDEEGEDVDDEEEDEDEDVDIDDVIPSESDVISSEDDEDEDDDVITSEEEEEEEDDVIISEEEEEEEEDDVIISEDEEDDVDEITNHTQELNKGYELDGLINGEGGAPYNVEISDAMKEDAYFEHMQLQQRMLDEDDVEEEEEEVEDEDEDEDEYDEDLDDELVPRWLNNKFERQRMRKLGKKVYPKMKKSKRMVNQYNRPGCAGAKHGLGLNNNLVW